MPWSSAFFQRRQTDRPSAAEEADRATDGLLSKLIERKEITGKKFELVPLLAPPGIAAGQFLVVGLGERNQFDAGTAFRAAAAAAKATSPANRVKPSPIFWATQSRSNREPPSPARSSAAKGKTFIAPKRNAIRSRKSLERQRRRTRSGARPSARRSDQSHAAAGERAAAGYVSRIVRRPRGRGGQSVRAGVRNLGPGAAGKGALRIAAGRGPRFVAAAAAGDSALSRRTQASIDCWHSSAKA